MAVTTALGSNILVIEVRWYPPVTTMAIIALRRGRQVIKILTHRSNAIMTART